MKKKILLKRIEDLEFALGRILQREEVMAKRVLDLEEIVFEVDLCDAFTVGEPDERSN